jgi:uncharacterized membrane protein
MKFSIGNWKKIFCVLIVLVFSFFGMVIASTFVDNSQSEFDDGIYNRTFYNSSGFVQLNSTYFNGTYLSQIFDAATSSQWNNISWVSGSYYGLELADDGEVESNLGGINMTGNIGLWHLNDGVGNGGTIVDSSGNGEDGTAYFSGSGTCFGIDGKLSNGCSFDGTTDYIDISIDIPATVTISAWAKYSVVSPIDMLWCLNNAGTGGPNLLFYNGVVSLNTWDGSNNPFCSIPDNTEEWHLYTTIIDSAGTKLYVDGNLCGTATYKNPTKTSMAISSSNGYDWAGQIDEFAIWNRTLSEEEILNLYERGATRLNLSARTCDDQSCAGENWTDIQGVSPQNLTLNNDSYFQYRFEFETDNVSYMPELYNVTVDYSVIPSLDHYYVETYEKNMARSYFSNGTTIEIRTNLTGITTPTITVTDSDGNIWVNEDNMVNVSNLFVYNYTLNGSQGWYDVTINSQDWQDVFYQGETWQGNYTDEDGNPFSFRRKINVTEPGIMKRFFEPIDISVNFSYQQANNSVRVLAYNGSSYLEIPSQKYNTNKSGTTLYSANIVFLSSLNQSETREYYIVSSKTASDKEYTTDLTYSNTSDQYKISNSYFTTFFNTSTGGLMQDVYDAIGTNSTLSGVQPIDYYPEYQIGLTTYSSRADTSVAVSNVEGPVLYIFNISGQSNDDSSKPYTYNCKIYSKNYQVICEKNQTTTGSQDWKNFYINGLIAGDGVFSLCAYENSSDIIINETLATVSNLDQNMKWIAFYDTLLGNAIGEIFLNKSFSTTNNPSFSIIEDSGYDYYQQGIIDSTSQTINSGDCFYTKTAKLIYNGLREYDFVDQMYDKLQNPLTVGQDSEETSDTGNPYYSSNGSIATTDQVNLTFYSYWLDDSFLDYAVINITGPGVDGVATQIYQNISSTIRSGGSLVNESSVNVTLNSSDVNAGNITCNITVYDIAGKYNSTLIVAEVSDATPPAIDQLSNNPSSIDNLDPNATVTINSTFVEYSVLDRVYIYYRNNDSGSWSAWNNSEMFNISQENYNYTYEGNFTPLYNTEYQYYVSANDTSSNAENSSTYNLSIYYDYTWNLIDNLTANSGVFDTNISLGNVTLNNTGDYSLSFIGSAGVYGARIFINGSQANTNPQFEVENGTALVLDITGTTRESGQTEGTDSVTVTFSNSTANPTSDAATVSLVTISGGPFLHTEITQYNQTINLGDTGMVLTSRVTNLGNETATNTNVTFSIPSGWNTQYSLTSNLGNLTEGSPGEYSITVDVPSSADTGAQTVTANSICSENKNGTASVVVTVIDPNAGGGDTPGDSGGSSGGGGGGGNSLDTEESSRFFSSEDSFELVRGEDQTFVIQLENPYGDAILRNLDITLDGFSEDYIYFYPNRIEELGVEESENITVEITAPGYFTKGKYDLKFTFEGDLVKNASTTIDFKYDKDVILYLFDVSRADAVDYRAKAISYLEEMREKGYVVQEMESLFGQLDTNYDNLEFGIVKELFKQIDDLYSAAVNSAEGIIELEEAIEEAEKRLIPVDDTKRLVHLAKSSFERGNYFNSLERVKEAKLTLAIESSGKFFKEMRYAMKENPGETTAGFGAFGVSVVGLSLFGRWRYLKRKLKKLGEEENLLTELMRAVQIEVFERAKMSMKEYGESMIQYEERFGKIIADKITFESKKNNLLKFKAKRKRLNEERESLTKIMAETQEAYITKGKFETRIYENMLKSYSTRLSDVEEQLALLDVKKARGGKN